MASPPRVLIQLVAIAKKELSQTFRDRRMAAVLIVAPVLQLTLLGFAVDLDVDNIDTAVVDQDRTSTSRDLATRLTNDDIFRTRSKRPLCSSASRSLASARSGSPSRCGGPAALLQSGNAKVVLVLPRGLGRDLARGSDAQVQVLIDGSDPLQSTAAMAAAEQAVKVEALRLAGQRLAQRRALSTALASRQRPTIRIHPRIYYNPRLQSPLYMIPGVAAMVLLIVTTLVTAMSIARERELGTIEQLSVTPLRPIVLLGGKIIPFALIGFIVAHLVIAIGCHLFDVPIRGSLALIAGGTLLYLLSTLGTGVFISTFAKNQQQAILGGFVFLMPAILLSGFMSPIENMPPWAQWITVVNPVRYYVEFLRGCMLKGATLVDVSRQLIALALFGVAILGASALRFKKRLA